ncbi:MAG: SDR family oxidoreductase [Chloroflexota bacterium]|nr:SDR family oxidoreductase [Chloroflexota bacterium]
MDLELSDRVAIVTGGSRGIGKAIARQLALEGASVAIVARDNSALEASRDELIADTDRPVLAVRADTTNDDAVRDMVERVVDQFGRVDILVNAAAKPGGQAPPPALADITEELFLDDMQTKVMGYLRCAQAVAPHMVRQGWGRIVNISGLAARSTGATIGSIRNVAVVALTKNLADELGPHGINVTVVHPGLTRTEKTAGVVAERARSQEISEEEVERQMAAGNTVRRIIDARDIAYVVAFLASPKSIAINGDVIAAGGGAPRSIYY